MGTINFVDGPTGKGFTGHFGVGGFSGYYHMGRCQIIGSDTRNTVEITNGGMMGLPTVFTQHTVVDETLVPILSGTGSYNKDTGILTLDRSGTDSSPFFDLLCVFNS